MPLAAIEAGQSTPIPGPTSAPKAATSEAAAAKGADLSVFFSLLTALTQQDNAQAPVVANAADPPAPKTKREKGASKDDGKDGTSPVVTVVVIAEIPAPAIAKPPITLDPAQNAGQSIPVSSLSPDQTRSNSGAGPLPVPDISSGKLLSDPTSPMAPVAKRLAFTAQLSPLDVKDDAKGSPLPEQAIEPPTQQRQTGDPPTEDGSAGQAPIPKSAPLPDTHQQSQAQDVENGSSIPNAKAGKIPPAPPMHVQHAEAPESSGEEMRKQPGTPVQKEIGPQSTTQDLRKLLTQDMVVSAANTERNITGQRESQAVRDQTTKIESKSEINVPLQAPQTRQISLSMGDTPDARVDVRLIDRGGNVHVAVRTDDRDLTRSLQSDLGDLVGRLERKGYSAAAWAPGERITSSAARETSADQDHGGNFGSAQQQQQNQPGRGDSQRRQRMPWEPEMGQSFSLEEGQSESDDYKSN